MNSAVASGIFLKTKTFRELRKAIFAAAGVAEHEAFIGLSPAHRQFFRELCHQEFELGFDKHNPAQPELGTMKLLSEEAFVEWLERSERLGKKIAIAVFKKPEYLQMKCCKCSETAGFEVYASFKGDHRKAYACTKADCMSEVVLIAARRLFQGPHPLTSSPQEGRVAVGYSPLREFSILFVGN